MSVYSWRTKRVIVIVVVVVVAVVVVLCFGVVCDGACVCACDLHGRRKEREIKKSRKEKINGCSKIFLHHQGEMARGGGGDLYI